VIDGGWAMGSDLPLFGRRGPATMDAASIQPGKRPHRPGGETVRTAEGSTGALPSGTGFGTLSAGAPLLRGARLALRGRAGLSTPPAEPRARDGVMRAESAERRRSDPQVAGPSGPAAWGWETARTGWRSSTRWSRIPTLWNDPERAQKLMRERQRWSTQIGTATRRSSAGLSDNSELIELGEAEGDSEVVAEAEAALKALAERAAAKELEALLDGEADANDTFLEINAGAGGTESCDWAAMLARMYTRWAEEARLQGRAAIRKRGRRGGDQVRHLQDLRPQRLWLAEIGIGRAPAGADLAL
jgi:hypothetical protein